MASSFPTQANALLRKNLVLQRRRWKTNACLVAFPALLCLLLFSLQLIINKLNDTPKFKCGCKCVPVADNSTSGAPCQERCGVEYSTETQAVACAILHPPDIPPMMQIPQERYRAVDLGGQFPDFPDPSCRSSGDCPLVFLFTGGNRSVADSLVDNMIRDDPPPDPNYPYSTLVPGTSKDVPDSLYLEPALPNSFLLLERRCDQSRDIPCARTRMIWRDNKTALENDLYRGYSKGDMKRTVNEIPVAYDFRSTSSSNLDVSISYNITLRGVVTQGDSPILRVARSMNLAAKAFLKLKLNSTAELPFSFIKGMPKPETNLLLNFSTLLGPLAYLWVIQLLLPVMLTSLVYEKEQNLRMMMKMHGLGDGAYWHINYLYFLAFSIVYTFLFVLFGSIVGLDFFRQNSYTIMAIFFLVYVNLQIALAFLGSTVLSHVNTATVIGYLYVFGIGLAATFIFQNLIEDKTVARAVITLLELIPGFSVFRGLYEFSEYATTGVDRGTKGMRWKNLNDSQNGMREVLVIMAVEWALFLLLAAYLDQVISSGSGVKKHPLFFLGRSVDNVPVRSSAVGAMEEIKPDVQQEKAVVERGLEAGDSTYSIICDNLRKSYPSMDGNPEKHAVRGLSLAIKRGECFGMLGPNGAGKTTSINMMIGFSTPSSGRAFVAGLDITKNMNEIYTLMGVCPQHDLLWETLTGREHLLFYGRLKNLKGAALEAAVQGSLRSVNLEAAGSRQAGKYSGGMKRRLSVAISLIGEPKAVYMDEPSTGLDPASRRMLWNAVKTAKRNCAIILTTHSMEEAEALCDRVGIFVNGQLQCIGSSSELKARYAGSFVFSVIGDPSKEAEVCSLVHGWSPRAQRTYNIGGAQKFELPKEDVSAARVFKSIAPVKTELGIQAWGLTDTTLENVFIKVAEASICEGNM